MNSSPVRRLALLLGAVACAGALTGALTGAPAGAAATSSNSVTVSPSAPIAPLPYLHVTADPSAPDPTPYLADPGGRQVLLHGAAVVGLQDVAYPNANGGPALFPVNPSAYDGKCPQANALIPQPPLCEVEANKPAYEQSSAPGSGDDFAELRAMGFNVIRLVLSWSQLEPQPGHYSTLYLDRVAQVVGWAKQQGIYVILDMHQDEYSRFITPAKKGTKLPGTCTPSGGSDGAPKWAVMADGKPGCDKLAGQTELNPATAAAFYNFWHNATVKAPQGQSPGPGLEDHYIGAMVALAQRFEHQSTVLGYEIMNEPVPGSLNALPVGNLYQSSSQDLYPFYQRAIEALTGVRDGLPTCPTSTPTSLTNACAYPKLASVSHQQIFFEPSEYRNLVDFSPQVSKHFSDYPNLVFAPHIYTHAFTVDTYLGYTSANSPYPPSYTFGYQTAEAEARAMGAAVFTTEFGDSTSTDSTIVSGELSAQEQTLTGGTVWAWKGLSRTEGTCWCVRWLKSSFQTTSQGTPGVGNPRAPVSPDDLLVPSRQLILERVTPRATAGQLLAEGYQPASKSFVMVASQPQAPVRLGDRSAETVISIPATVHGAVTTSGQARIDTVEHLPDGSRLVYVDPTAVADVRPAVTYQVTVGSPPAAFAQSVVSEATSPLPPIAEPTARAMLEQLLAQASTSTNPTVKSKSVLANALAALLLGPTDPNTTATPTP